MKRIVPIYPPALLKEPKIVAAIERGEMHSPVSIEHSLIKCTRCHRDGWIGPKQREFAATGGGEVVCIYCIRAEPGLKSAALLALNPGIEDVPRR